MKKSEILEMWKKRIDELEALKDVLDSIDKEDIELSDVWNKCMEIKKDVDRCMDAMWGLGMVVDASFVDWDEARYLPVRDYNEDFYKWVEHLLNMMGADVRYRIYYEFGTTYGVDKMVLESFRDIVIKNGLDPVRWLDQCVKMFDPQECIMEFVNIVHDLKKRGKI